MPRSLLLLTLPILMIFLSGFSAPPPNKKHTIPRGLVGVRFTESETIKPVELTYQEAKEEMLKEELKWFFKEFDQDYLVFSGTRYVPNPEKYKRPWGTYITEKIYRIKRSKKAEAEFLVNEIIEFYEVGERGIKGGMTETEVVEILGKPKSVNELGPFGSFDYAYDDFTVRFLDYQAADIK